MALGEVTLAFPELTLRIRTTGLTAWGQASYPEEFLCGAGFQGPIGNLCLLGQVFSALDGGHHSLHCKEGSQVGRV